MVYVVVRDDTGGAGQVVEDTAQELVDLGLADWESDGGLRCMHEYGIPGMMGELNRQRTGAI